MTRGLSEVCPSMARRVLTSTVIASDAPRDRRAWRGQGWDMANRLAPFGVVSLVLFAASGAVCQNQIPSLPDAPSEPAVKQSQVLDQDELSVLKGSSTEIWANVIRASAFAGPQRSHIGQAGSKNVFTRYLYPSSARTRTSYRLPADGSLMSRATHAATKAFVTRDGSGRAKVNTSYFLRALTSVAADTASRPYWRRSRGEPLSDFGSTVGNDAGVNVLHEFGPGIQQLMKNHVPRFVSRIAERVGHK